MIPSDLRSLSCDWLSEVLHVPVMKFAVVDAHAGTTGRALLELDYGEDAGQPQRLFVKLPPTDELQRQFVTSSGMGRREAMFYHSLAAEMPVRVPRCFYAASDEAGEAYIMLLENLVDSGCTFKNASTRYSLDFIRQILAAFARLHAKYWQSPRFESDLAWVQPPLQHEIGAQLIGRALQMYSDSMPVVFTEMGELYLAKTDAVHQLWLRGAPTLIHGDVHDGNLFYDADQPGFLDWAMVARGPAMRDVGYFLAGNLTPQDQQQYGRDMLAYYRQQLLSLGVSAPPEAELWQQYQWHAAYVWMGAAVTLAMGDAWQPVNYLKASMERLHSALDTLGSVDAIRSAL
ncbi:Stress response kinase A [Halioglobus japonicus]|nr:Stress response kinase A [Halioglobus japonicus]